ncbi:lumenal Hsp70 protein [Coemansia furcata]|uniref:Lumenal Hsp70 protein n=1 Tax=Coemansia furcata TaxID=417177 RepID=A0ACC1LJS3_9FUNG|nr:lumenal Hsp70 protein [Coemansia furcata]
MMVTSTCVNAAVLGIDFGTDWFTIALANPGRPLDLVLNRDANRQTASVVTVNGLERTFGSNAIAIAPRLPEKTFMAVRNLLGVSYDSDVAAAYRKQFPNRMVKEPLTGMVGFQYGANANETLTVQEIVAMQLRHAQQLVKESEGVVVKDAVFTVPSFFDRNQRQAMLDAAQLAGFRTLALVNDGSAVALNYAMSRSFAKPEKHVFYDMGAGKTVATVAGFSMRSAAKALKSKKATVINVQAFAADSTLGGQEVDFVVRDLLVDKFMASNREADVRGNDRAMNRLLKEAKRVKTILSANTEATASVEGVLPGIDFRTQVSRADFERATKHLAQRIRGPIDDALKAAGLSIGDIDSVVLVGGGTRMPFVQKTLGDAFGAAKLSRNVNAEEACVMGAVFKGATLSSLFRVKDMRLRDAMAYAVRATYPTESKSLLGGTKQETMVLYPEFGAVGARRVIRDTRASDFSVNFAAKPSAGNGGAWADLMSVKVSGVPGAKGKLKSKQVVSEKPEVRVIVQTNELGAFEVLKAEAAFNVTNPGHAAYLEDLALWETESAQWEASTAEAESSAAEPPKKASLRARPTPPPEVVIEVVQLDIDVATHGLVRLGGDALEKSRALLQLMDDDDSARAAHHGAVNGLESLIYQLRDLVDDASDITTDQQRDALSDAVSAAADWLDAHADSAALEDIRARAAQLKDLKKPIVFRRTQMAKRPEHISALRAIIKQAQSLVELYRVGYTSEELEPASELLQGLEDTLGNTTTWLDNMVAKQEALALSDDPVLTTTDIDDKAVGIERSLAKLVAKKIKKKAPEVPVSEPSKADDAEEEEGDYEPKSQSTQDKSEPGHDEL